MCKTIKPNDKLRHDGFFFFSSFEWMCGLFNALHQTLLAQVIVSLHRIMWQPVVPTDTFSFSLSSTTHFCVYVFSGEIFYILLFFIVVEKCYFFFEIFGSHPKKKSRLPVSHQVRQTYCVIRIHLQNSPPAALLQLPLSIFPG